MIGELKEEAAFTVASVEEETLLSWTSDTTRQASFRCDERAREIRGIRFKRSISEGNLRVGLSLGRGSGVVEISFES